MLHAVIMAGGSGTRFWPRSRRSRPKQLIEIVGKGTMIQQTVERLQAAVPAESILIITNGAQAGAMREQLPALAPEQIVAEPCGRDTAACIGLAAFIIRQTDPDGVMGVFSADHVISPAEELARCIKEAAEVAREHGVLVAFGIKPRGPSELYGYIHRGEAVANRGGALPAFKVAEFREKPDHSQAEEFVSSGEYYWNSGNFMWRVSAILDAIRTYLPELHRGLERIASALGTAAEDEAMAREYPKLPQISIDYGVMEKAPNAIVIEAPFEWDDVGSWNSVARHYPADEHGNVTLAPHAGVDTSDCILAGADGHLLATVGVRNLIVVHTDDATLVCDRNRASEVKTLVELLRSRGSNAYL